MLGWIPFLQRHRVIMKKISVNQIQSVKFGCPWVPCTELRCLYLYLGAISFPDAAAAWITAVFSGIAVALCAVFWDPPPAGLTKEQWAIFQKLLHWSLEAGGRGSGIASAWEGGAELCLTPPSPSTLTIGLYAARLVTPARVWRSFIVPPYSWQARVLSLASAD